MVKVQASNEQVQTFMQAIQLWRRTDAKIRSEMDEDGTMILFVVEDGVQSFARFGNDGLIIGDWIW